MNVLDGTTIEALLSAVAANRDLLRLLVSPAAVLRVSTAAALLPWGDARARAWLRSQGIVRDVDGVEVVLWGDVIASLPEAPRNADPETRATPRGRRTTRPAFVRGGGL